jgi:AraC-like DNA-binding protein
VDKVKLLLASDSARRWTLSQIAAEVNGSPVYLTQVFHQLEGIPLYRYQLRLRLARSLELIERYSDLTALALELGFPATATSALRSAKHTDGPLPLSETPASDDKTGRVRG